MAVADLGVGLLVQPLYVAFIMSPLMEINGDDVFYVLQVGLTLCWCLGQVSILTLAAISVDRLLALFLGLRYRHVVTLRRVTVVIVWFWSTGALAGWIQMQIIDLAHKQASVIGTLSLLTMIICYTTIHLKLRHQHAQLHNNVPQGTIALGGEAPLHLARYKKTISSILWVQLAFVACYVPLGIVIVLYLNGISYIVRRVDQGLL